jgi:CheY-like chemotaxis protein
MNAVDVLVVDDDPGDVMMIGEAFGLSPTPVRLHVANDGEQAVSFLRRGNGFADAPRPSLIVLDLHLPRRNGLEVLAELKTDRDLLLIPVVMLSTSSAAEDIQRSYSLHANAYITKPADFDRLADVVRQITGWFFGFIELPPAGLAAPAPGSPRGPV